MSVVGVFHHALCSIFKCNRGGLFYRPLEIVWSSCDRHTALNQRPKSPPCGCVLCCLETRAHMGYHHRGISFSQVYLLHNRPSFSSVQGEKLSRRIFQGCLFCCPRRMPGGQWMLVHWAMNSQDLPAKDAPLTVNEQVPLKLPSKLSEGPSPAAAPLENFTGLQILCCHLPLSPPCASIPYHNRMINSTQQFIEIGLPFPWVIIY